MFHVWRKIYDKSKIILEFAHLSVPWPHGLSAWSGPHGCSCTWWLGDQKTPGHSPECRDHHWGTRWPWTTCWPHHCSGLTSVFSPAEAERSPGWADVAGLVHCLTLTRNCPLNNFLVHHLEEVQKSSNCRAEALPECRFDPGYFARKLKKNFPPVHCGRPYQ